MPSAFPLAVQEEWTLSILASARPDPEPLLSPFQQVCGDFHLRWPNSWDVDHLFMWILFGEVSVPLHCSTNVSYWLFLSVQF